MPKKKLRIKMATGDAAVAELFMDMGHTIVSDSENSFDAAVFNGGADVTPFLYGHKKLAETYCDINRCMRENRFYRGLPAGIPKLGICRGAQFLNVMNGGLMWQHCIGHGGREHKVYDVTTDSTFTTNSVHHQIMIPADEAEIVAYTETCHARIKKMDGESRIVRDQAVKEEKDIEVLYYHDDQALCFQAHPEYRHLETKEYFRSLCDRYLDLQL